ncbi:sel1 repeat family protein [Pseudomonas sp. FFUP_PS_473]|jgi:TPR repeat protein|uniref:tetratricopeptide repeat protein n=1 Tax=Pseudomonas TaxID=286 RepID=UPI000811781E|nr:MULTISPECIES: SEL1-like repeat protein [Pseudomonas]ATR84358.1 sel1 repeat family protein [Pseudomonas sp. HLS-6]MEE3634823.1 SEL1-like repeat protein [Pseudomonas sp. AL 58]PLP88932.1 sel1 repeat family protein [Pseudomonas sp. FFUP_PS_473]WJM96362.1 SEL1-like repeat protein [Pseudomonas defluvii]
MKFRSKVPASSLVQMPLPEPRRLSLKVALWLLDSPRLGDNRNIKHIAGRLLKQPARQGVVVAQSRLGQMLCRDCGNARDRRIGHELLRQAARAGDRRAQLEYGRLCAQPQFNAPEQARHWLEQAAGQGSQEAARLLKQLLER